MPQEEQGPCCILWPGTGLSPQWLPLGDPPSRPHSLQEEWARARPVLARDRSEQRGSKRPREMAPTWGELTDPKCQGPRVDQLLEDPQKQQSKDEL